jgi:ABC-type polar amino acid transport system ATPase subunit
MIKTKLTANELLDAVNSQWASVDDIMLIGSVGINKARLIRNVIEREINESGFILPKRLVPMAKVIDYFKIDINFLKKVANHSKRN